MNSTHVKFTMHNSADILGSVSEMWYAWYEYGDYVLKYTVTFHDQIFILLLYSADYTTNQACELIMLT
jgi:hypothetical protein